MEMELSRHNWAAFTGRGADTARLPVCIRELFTTTDPEVSARVAEFIARCACGDQLLADVSPATAAALVHGIWTCRGPGRDDALDILAEIAGARVSTIEPDAYGIVSEADCMSEIARGLPIYVEILENGQGRIRAACIDLIYACGRDDPWTRERAKFYLRTALDLPGLAEFHDLLLNSLTDLDAADGSPGR